MKQFQASLIKYGSVTIYAESKEDAEEKAKYLRADEIQWIKNNGNENMLVYIVEIPSADEQA